MNTSQTLAELFRRPPLWLTSLYLFALAFLRLVYMLAVLGGCAYVVFWRDQSAWFFVLALFLLRFRSAF